MLKKTICVLAVVACAAGFSAEGMAAPKGGANRSPLTMQLRALGYTIGARSGAMAAMANQVGRTASLSAYARQYRSNAAKATGAARGTGGVRRPAAVPVQVVGVPGVLPGVPSGVAGFASPVPGSYGPNLNQGAMSPGGSGTSGPSLSQYGPILDASSGGVTADTLAAAGIGPDQIAALAQQANMSTDQLMALISATVSASTSSGGLTSSSGPSSSSGNAGTVPVTAALPVPPSGTSAFSTAFTQAMSKGPAPSNYQALASSSSVSVSQYGTMAGVTASSNFQYGGITGSYKGPATGSAFSQGMGSTTQSLGAVLGITPSSSSQSTGTIGGSLWEQSSLYPGSQSSGMLGQSSALQGTSGQ